MALTYTTDDAEIKKQKAASRESLFLAEEWTLAHSDGLHEGGRAMG